MATITAAEKQTPADGNPAPAKSGGAIVKITALLFVVAVILAECLVAYLYLPSHTGPEVAAAAPEQGTAKEPEAKAEEGKAAPKGEHGKAQPKAEHGARESLKSESGKKQAAKGGHGKKGEPEENGEAGADSGGIVEIDLEQFAVTAHQPASATTMRIEFHLYGMVSADNKEEFERLIKASYHRFREQVLVIVRSTEATDLADAGLGLIKRQILEKTNTLLGKPLLQAVVVSDFSYIEQ